ncbi:AAA family ATPase [Lysinibacillus sp. BW-2-10]|uniref:AAA family ATPase n=1 Tax=Lysinibacillus sp. BW-2-10 TaxID=2590030 RepID=UPI00118146FB|nr:AAA family ATPase [Lysinibacillus sp. BW-2-10]TSI04286.1 AAA family ATPase [Lysinibacillus sp. BW-2-10]
MESKLNILIVSDEPVLSQQLKNIAESTEENVLVASTTDAIREMNRETRDIVIMTQNETDLAIDLVQSMRQINPLVLIICIAQQTDFVLLRNLMRAGTDEFFVFPEETSLFTSRFPTTVKNYAIQKNSRESATAKSFGRGRGQIFSFYSGKGGSGKTVISSVLAQTLKLESTAEVILIDLNGQYGGVESMFSIESNRSLADLLPVIEELNESHIRNVSKTEENSKLEILVSPIDAEVAETLGENFVAKLLRTSRRAFDYVIIDLPSNLTGPVITAMEESDKIYYVLTPDTPALKVLKYYEDLSARIGVNLMGRMEIVLNNISKENEVQQKDLKNVLRYPIAASVRKDIKGLQPFINKGEPVRKVVKERKLIPFAKDVRKFTREILKQ